MSKYLALALVLSLMGVGGMAFGAEGAHHRDGYSMRNGKIVVTRGGHETELTAEVRLTNGLRLQPDGVIILADGRRDRFIDGKWLTFDGEFVALDAPDTVVVDDGYFWRDGHLYVVRGGVETIVTTEVVLDDGIRLLPDGFIVERDGTRRRFDAGVRLSLQGKPITGKAGFRSPEDVKAQDTGRRIDGNTNPQTNRPQTNPTTPQNTEKTRPETRTPATPNEHEKSVNPENSRPENKPAVEDRERRPAQQEREKPAQEEREKSPAK